MDENIINELSQIIRDRKKQMPNDSYVAKLFKKGKVKIANKFGEEATETLSAFLAEGKNDLIEETADLIFHLLILLESADISMDDVLQILKKRMKND